MAYLLMADSAPGFKNAEYVQKAKERIAERTTVTAEGCHECSKGINDTGYSTVWFHDRMWRTHRLLWFIERGEIPAHLTLDHLCLNRRCCNLDHLELVTLGENARRATRGPNSSLEHCQRGHRYTEKDLRPNGVRDCRECHRITRRQRYYANPEEHRAKSAVRKAKCRKAKRTHLI